MLRREDELKHAGDEIDRIDETLKKRNLEAGEARKKQDAVKKELEEQKKALEEILDGQLLREYRAEKEALLREKSLRDRIASLEEQRAALEDGSPCPLCGSTHHPYVDGKIPGIDETDEKIRAVSNLIARAEKQEELLKSLEEKLRRAAEERQGSEVRLAALEQEKKSTVNAQEGLKKAALEAREFYNGTG